MKDVTIIIQGKIEQESYNFWKENYKECNVIISTWVGCDIDMLNLPDNFIVILSQCPLDKGDQNLNYQLVSTLNALNAVKTKYVIKQRGDAYFSNFEYIRASIETNKNKIWTSPIFFRAWQFAEYHISDHIIAGTVENIKLMFESTKYNFDNNKLNKSKWKHEDGTFWKWGTVHSPEERLTRSYLYAKEPNRYEIIDGRILMKEYFDILNLDILSPYKIRANIFKKTWVDGGFIPERNFSISTIEQLFSDEPYKIPNK
jgi:hypothetical protein